MIFKKVNICISLLILLIIRVVLNNEKAYFILSLIYLGGFIFQYRRLIIPYVKGINLYIFCIVTSTIMGLIKYSALEVVRDLFYVLPTIVWIFVGYYLYKQCKSINRIYRTLYIYGAIVSTFCIAKFIIHPNLSYDGFKTGFVLNVYEVGFILPLLIFEVFLLKNIIFGKKIDKILIILMSIQITFSLGRIAILIPLIILFIIFLLIIFYYKDKGKHLLRITKILGVIFVVSYIVIVVTPQEIIEQFLEKILRSFHEVSYLTEISSVGAAMKDWRGYEMQAALENWKESNLLIKIFGEGMGKGINIKYIPFSWGEMIKNNQLPLAHNGFFTLLPKGGIISVLSLLWIFLINIITGLKFIKNKKYAQYDCVILVAINVAVIAHTYVVRGPVQQGALLVWAILLGAISAHIRNWYNKSFNN